MSRIWGRWRWAVPVVIAGLVVGGARLQAWADSSTPDLPTVSARDLLVKVQTPTLRPLSGTVRSAVHLGLPELPRQPGVNWSSLVSGTQTLRVYADGAARQRVDLLGELAQASIVHDGHTLWTWSSTTREVTKTSLPPAAARHATPQQAIPSPSGPALPTPQAVADRVLAALNPSTTVSVGPAARVADRDAYDLRLQPRDDGSLIGSVDLYVDAATGLVLRTVVTPRGSQVGALDVGFTSLRFEAPPPATFQFTPPPGARVRDLAAPADLRSLLDSRKRQARPDVRVLGSGWTTVVAVPGGSSQLTALMRAAKPVTGPFGSGRLLATRLLTVLQLDDGRVLVGAVTTAEMLRQAGSSALTSTR